MSPSRKKSSWRRGILVSMPLPMYPEDNPQFLRRTKYTLPSSSPKPVVGVVPDDQVLLLDSVKAMAIGVQAAVGQTLTGSGRLLMYRLDAANGAADWGRTPDLDVTIPADANGETTCWFPDVATYVRAGRMHVRTEGVGTSGNGEVTIHAQAWTGAL